MSNVVIVGAQWGDEGKGKIVDYLTRYVQMTVRCQGGNNAGHTVVVRGEKTILHLVPSGVLHRGVHCVLGNGVVVDPAVLLGEIDSLKARGYLRDDRKFHISDRAHLIMPYHKTIDLARERRLGKGKIGTTGRGIGPAYEDKMARRGIRFCDLLSETALREKLRSVLAEKNAYLRDVLGEKSMRAGPILRKYKEYAERLGRYVTDTSVVIHKAMTRGKNLLFEGAQGTHLDIDHGTYPFVTSSNSCAGGICTGSGVGPTQIDQVIGIAKAYTTRVGAGPCPTELQDEMGERLREKGGEYGSTTGRPRRCGWFDAVAVRSAVRLNGFTSLILTKLDVLTGLDRLQICVAYRHGDKIYRDFPADLGVLGECEPVYEEVKGWRQDITWVRDFEDLPQAARRYVRRLEKQIGSRFSMISVGAGREETNVIQNPFLT